MSSFVRIALLSAAAALVIAGGSVVTEPANGKGQIVVHAYRLAWS